MTSKSGGCNTNKNGLPYEKLTNLTELIIFKTKNKKYKTINFNGYEENEFIQANKTALFEYMKNKMNKKIKHAHGCKQPDECYIYEKTKKIFIIEKKFQQCNGSVCEKIQTPDFKMWQYSRLFPEYTIIYIYVLSEWFKENCYSELEYLEYKKIPIFWGNSKEYKKDIITYINNSL
jgi:hypothetical protein